MKNAFKKALVALTVLSLCMIAVPASAAAVAVSNAPSTASASTATDINVSFIAGAEFAADDTVTIRVPAAVTLANGTTPTTDADGDTTVDGAGVVVGTDYTYTFAAATTAASTTGVTFQINITAPAGNYFVSVFSSKGDFGGAMVYVGNANVVPVTVNVMGAMEFSIGGETTLTYNLDPVIASSDETKVTTLSVRTNAASGFTVTMTTAGLPVSNKIYGAAPDKGFYVTSSDLGDKISGQIVFDGLGLNNTAETANITNKIMIDWTVPAGSYTGGTITYTVVPLF